jgi:hypothetical protein
MSLVTYIVVRFFLLLLFVFTASSATVTWTGATSSNWTDGTNWNPNGVPIASSDVVIPSSSCSNNCPTLGSSTTVNSITLDGLNASITLTVNSNAVLTVTSYLTIGTSSSTYCPNIALSNATLNIPAAATVTLYTCGSTTYALFTDITFWSTFNLNGTVIVKSSTNGVGGGNVYIGTPDYTQANMTIVVYGANITTLDPNATLSIQGATINFWSANITTTTSFSSSPPTPTFTTKDSNVNINGVINNTGWIFFSSTSTSDEGGPATPPAVIVQFNVVNFSVWNITYDGVNVLHNANNVTHKNCTFQSFAALNATKSFQVYLQGTTSFFDVVFYASASIPWNLTAAGNTYYTIDGTGATLVFIGPFTLINVGIVYFNNDGDMYADARMCACVLSFFL